MARAEEKSAAYHARRKANAKEREATAAPALAAPAEPSFATQMAQMMAALSAQEDQDTATAAKSARPSAATFPVVRYDENDDELPPPLCQPRPENFPRCGWSRVSFWRSMRLRSPLCSTCLSTTPSRLRLSCIRTTLRPEARTGCMTKCSMCFFLDWTPQ